MDGRTTIILTSEWFTPVQPLSEFSVPVVPVCPSSFSSSFSVLLLPLQWLPSIAGWKCPFCSGLELNQCNIWFLVRICFSHIHILNQVNITCYVVIWNYKDRDISINISREGHSPEETEVGKELTKDVDWIWRLKQRQQQMKRQLLREILLRKHERGKSEQRMLIWRLKHWQQQTRARGGSWRRKIWGDVGLSEEWIKVCRNGLWRQNQSLKRWRILWGLKSIMIFFTQDNLDHFICWYYLCRGVYIGYYRYSDRDQSGLCGRKNWNCTWVI